MHRTSINSANRIAATTIPAISPPLRGVTPAGVVVLPELTLTNPMGVKLHGFPAGGTTNANGFPGDVIWNPAGTTVMISADPVAMFGMKYVPLTSVTAMNIVIPSSVIFTVIPSKSGSPS